MNLLRKIRKFGKGKKSDSTLVNLELADSILELPASILDQMVHLLQARPCRVHPPKSVIVLDLTAVDLLAEVLDVTSPWQGPPLVIIYCQTWGFVHKFTTSPDEELDDVLSTCALKCLKSRASDLLMSFMGPIISRLGLRQSKVAKALSKARRSVHRGHGKIILLHDDEPEPPKDALAILGRCLKDVHVQVVNVGSRPDLPGDIHQADNCFIVRIENPTELRPIVEDCL